ncbi:hypothetical protein R3W88_027939 [Solanum pinnatisectum]|uniref:Uncharacterized protein n=1 Tax=Solanum pinnatisectum TaxID=50273 RepID=A0AAV9LJZ8_9SOLN|nr:hypothetical protein R3W88_027939 [Solanum pinnatisectum]
MGNCIVLLQNDKKKVIEYKAPMKVHEHEVSSPLLQEPKTKHVKKKVKFADEVIVMESSCSSSEVVRIKVVITKQELQSLLSSEGELRVLQDGNMVVQCPLQKEQSSISEINDCIIHELD